jgi:hypothetical protein
VKEKEFELRIIGEDVSPETVDVSDLLAILTGLRGALAETAAAGDETGLFLIDIKEGSDKLVFSAERATLDAARTITYALNSNNFENVPKSARRHLKQIWKTVFENGWDGCEFNGNGSGLGTAWITSSNELFPETKTIRGKTTLFGECQRVGGVHKKTAVIKLLSGESKSVQLKSRELALQLGMRLYQMVGLDGEGIWNSETLDLQEFRADSLSPYRDRNDSGKQLKITDSLQALSDASGNRWDNVNPEKYVEELRRD